MINASTLSLTLLLVATGASMRMAWRPFVARHIAKFFWSCVLAVFALQSYWSYMQFRIWQSVEPSKYLIPPYNSWGYFIQYVGWRFFAPYIISLAMAGIFFYLAKIFNARRDFSFFYDEEYYFIALAFFLSSHPGWLIYGFTTSIFAILVITFRNLILHKTEKFSLYHFWLPIAAVAILIMWALRGLEFVAKLGV